MANFQKIPVALFVYSRASHLAKTLEGLKKNNISLIYAFSDAPKDPSKAEQVKEVRAQLRKIDWTHVKITERESNLGLGTSIRIGVSEVLEYHEKVIVIEDDIVMRPGAYDYACAALNYYGIDDRVMSGIAS